MKMPSFPVAISLFVCAIGSNSAIAAPIGQCKFDAARLQFEGDDLSQARCLMRPVMMGGKLGPDAPLPHTLSKLIGTKPQFSRQQLEAVLKSSDSPRPAATGLDLGSAHLAFEQQ